MALITFQELARLTVFRKFYSLAREIFGVSIALMDPEGRGRGALLGPRTTLNPFCRALQRRSDACFECDYRYLQEVRRLRKPLRYSCWAGLSDFIIPIFVEGKIIAYLQCGQILSRRPLEKDWKRTRKLLAGKGVDPAGLKALYFKTLVRGVREQHGLISLLELFANYITDTSNRLLLLEKSRTSRIVAQAENFIKDRYREPLSLGSVARAACASKRTLTRVFHEETGLTVLQYIQKTRVERACEAMLKGPVKVIHAAMDSGFNTIQQFNRVFRQQKGCAPRAWRRRNAIRPARSS